MWIARVMLHMADEWIMPIDDVERTIGRDFQIDRTVIAVTGNSHVLPELGFEPGSVLQHLVLLGTQKTDGIV